MLNLFLISVCQRTCSYFFSLLSWLKLFAYHFWLFNYRRARPTHHVPYHSLTNPYLLRHTDAVLRNVFYEMYFHSSGYCFFFTFRFPILNFPNFFFFLFAQRAPRGNVFLTFVFRVCIFIIYFRNVFFNFRFPHLHFHNLFSKRLFFFSQRTLLRAMSFFNFRFPNLTFHYCFSSQLFFHTALSGGWHFF